MQKQSKKKYLKHKNTKRKYLKTTLRNKKKKPFGKTKRNAGNILRRFGVRRGTQIPPLGIRIVDNAIPVPNNAHNQNPEIQEGILIRDRCYQLLHVYNQIVARYTHLESQKTNLENQKTILETDNNELKMQNEELKMQNDNLKTNNNNLTYENGELKKQNGELEKQNGELEKQNKELKKQNGELEKQNKELKANIPTGRSKQNQPERASNRIPRLPAETHTSREHKQIRQIT